MCLAVQEMCFKIMYIVDDFCGKSNGVHSFALFCSRDRDPMFLGDVHRQTPKCMQAKNERSVTAQKKSYSCDIVHRQFVI